jgi:hypothetical protein
MAVALSEELFKPFLPSNPSGLWKEYHTPLLFKVTLVMGNDLKPL